MHYVYEKKMFWINESVLTYSPTKLIIIDVLSYRIFKIKIIHDEDVSKMYVFTDITFQNTRVRKKISFITWQENYPSHLLINQKS